MDDDEIRPVRLPAHLQRPSVPKPPGRHSVDHFENEQRERDETIGIVRPTKVADGGGFSRMSAKSLQPSAYRRHDLIVTFGLAFLVIFILLAVLLT
jgi:hypothetical protein